MSNRDHRVYDPRKNDCSALTWVNKLIDELNVIIRVDNRFDGLFAGEIKNPEIMNTEEFDEITQEKELINRKDNEIIDLYGEITDEEKKTSCNSLKNMEEKLGIIKQNFETFLINKMVKAKVNITDKTYNDLGFDGSNLLNEIQRKVNQMKSINKKRWGIPNIFKRGGTGKIRNRSKKRKMIRKIDRRKTIARKIPRKKTQKKIFN